MASTSSKRPPSLLSSQQSLSLPLTPAPVSILRGKRQVFSKVSYCSSRLLNLPHLGSPTLPSSISHLPPNSISLPSSPPLPLLLSLPLLPTLPPPRHESLPCQLPSLLHGLQQQQQQPASKQLSSQLTAKQQQQEHAGRSLATKHNVVKRLQADGPDCGETGGKETKRSNGR